MTATDTQIEIGSLWQHYKGSRYKVVTIGKYTEAIPPLLMVVYCSVEDSGQIWVRPLAGWPGAWTDTLPDGTPRFKKVVDHA